MKTINLAASALAILAAGGAAFAQTPPRDLAPVQAQETPGISQDAFLKQAEERFERLDQDGDGTVTPQERRAGRSGPDGGPDGGAGPRMARGEGGPGPYGDGPRGPRGGDPMERFDADGDGTITVEDFVARAEEHFARLDEDGDGELAAEEMRPPHHGPRHGDMRKGPHGSDHAFKRGPRGDRDGDGPRHARFDRDGGAPISEADYMAKAQERFDSLDEDGDGTVTAEERRAGREDGGYGNQWRHHWR